MITFLDGSSIAVDWWKTMEHGLERIEDGFNIMESGLTCQPEHRIGRRGDYTLRLFES